MAALLFVFTQIGLFGGNTTIAQSLFLSLFALILYTPLAYATDKFVYSRAQKRRAQDLLMDARYLTVGVVQENTWIARRDGAETAVLIDPGDEPEQHPGARSTTSA